MHVEGDRRCYFKDNNMHSYHIIIFLFAWVPVICSIISGIEPDYNSSCFQRVGIVKRSCTNQNLISVCKLKQNSGNTFVWFHKNKFELKYMKIRLEMLTSA